MKISTEIESATRLVGEHKAVELIAKAGFDAWDFSMFRMGRYDYQNEIVIQADHPLQNGNYLKFARELRKIGEDNGIHCNQSHAPFPTHVPQICSLLKRAIECTAEAGGKICIIHPDNNGSPEQNSEMYLELLPFAKACGVKIATENMWNWDEEKGHSVFAACATPESFNAHLDAVKDDFLIACLDIGHAEMKGSNTSAPEMIRALGSKLKALHIHDNDKLHDSHQIPFSMDINFTEVAKALKEINYNGYLTLECDQYLNAYTEETAFEGIKKLAEAAKRFDQMIKTL